MSDLTVYKMEETLGKIFDRIFNNWTALKLAVEHSLGGSNSVQVANDIKTYMVSYCLQNELEVEDIEETLEYLMDEEFETICEDESIKEISIIIHKFLQLLKENNIQQCEIEFNQLPEAKEQWLAMPQSQQARLVEDSDSSDDEETEDTPMDEDSEWTVVKTRKKK